ncbi:MAG: hypothetical protein RL199_1561 [Pseudomonadota bacterium]|jgi:hypothetical protein
MFVPMTDQLPPTAPLVNGKLFVIGFVATGALVLLLVLGLRASLHEQIQTAQLAALPTLAAPLEATCVAPGGERSRLGRGGSCRVGSSLELVVHSTGNGTEAVHYALMAPDGARTARIEKDRVVAVPLESPGPRVLGLLLANVVLPEGALEAALARGAGLEGKLQALDQYVAKLIDTDFHARAEALRFTVDP